MNKALLIFALFIVGFVAFSCGNSQPKSTTDSAANAETPQEPQSQAPDMSAMSGDYEFSTETANGTLTLNFTEGRKFDFSISVGEQSGCTGEISGSAEMSEDKTARFSEENCKELMFKFGEKEVTITEQECDYFHGMQCAFSGTYTKKI